MRDQPEKKAKPAYPVAAGSTWIENEKFDTGDARLNNTISCRKNTESNMATY
ncbi:MAG: hypothetical protein QME27_09985 [Syntrophaceae bacterium]|nr:hypothetical protein [Syntrophaceae bacterium]